MFYRKLLPVIDEEITVKKLLILIALTLMPITHLHAQIGQYRGVPPEQTTHTYIGFVTGLLPMIDSKSNKNIVLENNSALGLLWGYQSNDYLAVEFLQKNVAIADAVFQAQVGSRNQYFIGSGVLDMRSLNFNYFVRDISKEEEAQGTRKLVFSYGVGQYKGSYEGTEKVGKSDSYRAQAGDRGHFHRIAFGMQQQVKETVKRGGVKSYLNLRINYYHERVTASDFYEQNIFNTGLVDTISGVEFMVLSTF